MYVNWDKNANASAFKPKTWPERVEDKSHIGDFTMKKKFFLQLSAKSKGNSNLEIPGYSSPVLNGKGYTFNQLPNERYDDNQDGFLYKPRAYETGNNSLRPKSEVNKGMEMAKKLAEENKAIGVNLGEEELVKSDSR